MSDPKFVLPWVVALPRRAFRLLPIELVRRRLPALNTGDADEADWGTRAVVT